MQINAATSADWEALVAIRSHYDTDGAMQLDQERNDEATTTTFRPVKYPRVLRIDPEIRPPEVPVEDLDDEYYIVAAESGDDLLGYLRALADFDRGVGWITHLVVVPRHRRNQVGYTLLEHAKRWGDRNGLHHLQVEVETRNLPAIKFLERCGFSMAGYNEHLPRDRNIVVFYSFACG